MTFKNSVFLILTGFVFSTHAQLKNVKISNKTTFETSAWMDQGGALPKAGLARSLALAKKSFFANDKKTCLSNLKNAYAQGPAIRNWITHLEFKCTLIDKPGAADLERLVARVRKNPDWLLSDYFSDFIRPVYVEGIVRLAERYAKNNRVQAWRMINEALLHRDWLSDDQKADLFRYAGEISFVDQNLLAAKDYFQKSLEAKNSPDLRKRVDSILLAMKTSEKSAPVVAAPELLQNPVSKKDVEIYTRMNSAVQSKDYISAIEDGVTLLVDFPGGFYAEDANSQISSLYLGLATGSENTWGQLKKRVLGVMKKVGGDRLLTWSRLSYNRGLYQEAFELADEAAVKLSGQTLAADAFFLAAKSAQASREKKLAEKAFQKLINSYAGSPHVFEALFRLGLLHFKNKEFDESVAIFERLLSLKGAENYEYRALYWSWRGLQNLKLERAAEISRRLIERYPMTFYGMRALAEQSEGKIQLRTQKTGKIEVTMRLMVDQVTSWDRLPILLKSGWFEEAQTELSQLPAPQTAEEHLLRAKLFSLAQGYVLAITHLNRAMELNPEFAYQKEYLLWVFPPRFQNEIKKWSQAHQLSPVWVSSLIRQESAYQVRAVSRSNALGLMQLLPATAGEVARDLKKADLEIPSSLFEPGTNIELGTSYLKKMMGQFGGQLPFALAAYNAGPTRLKRWIDSGGVEVVESEIWMDELPWSETSFYVKSILRNILLIELLDKGQIQLNSPIWQISSKNP